MQGKRDDARAWATYTEIGARHAGTHTVRSEGPRDPGENGITGAYWRIEESREGEILGSYENALSRALMSHDALTPARTLRSAARTISRMASGWGVGYFALRSWLVA